MARPAWLAASGFRTRPHAGLRRDSATPTGGGLLRRVAAARGLVVLEGVGASAECPAEEFPLHAAEGVRTLALAPLSARGEKLGALVVGFRSAHEFAAGERETLEGLAGLAALALDNARLLETVIAGKKIWEQTFDAIPDGIIVHDAGMIITRSNAAAAEMMGLDAPAEAVGLSCAAAFARLFGERAAAYHMTHRAGTASSFEIQAEDGRRYLVAVAPLSTSLEPGVEGREAKAAGREPDGGESPDSGLQTPDSRPQASWSVITWSDVTQLSEMQEQLSRSRRLATVGQLAAGVAHEINNPLAAITTCAEATQRDLRSLPELAETARRRDWNFYLEEIVRQALRCKAITRGLLDLSRQRRARREPCDVNSLVGRTVKLFEER
ncbi:MAG: PAS domain S-box protein, partial [Acidobacteria bacterium]|nr:PAS domain S-box protein [Acidobacteriota bacterium]